MVGDCGWFTLAGFELYMLLSAGLPGILGFASRKVLLPRFLKSIGKGSVVGKQVLLRQPSRISIGKGVIVDDFTVLDVREAANQTKEPEIHIGDYCFIGRNTALVAKGAQISLGPGVNISSFCRIASETRIEIDESTLIASYVYIGPGNHHRDEETGRVVVEAAMEKRGGVRIGKGCWIGTRATILDGVTIGDNAIVGAHSLVRSDVPDGAVVAGVPAKILSQIKD